MIGVQVEPAMVPMCRLSRAWAEEELCEHMGLPVPSEQVQEAALAALSDLPSAVVPSVADVPD